jgi:hypothetical protein
MRVRIKRGENEVEVEGSAAEVEKNLKRLEPIVFGDAPATGISRGAAGGRKSTGGGGGSKPNAKPGELTLPAEFNEFVHSLPSTATGQDRLLAADYWVQQHGDDGLYTTSDAKALVEDNGFRVGNASQANTNNLKMGRVFKKGKKFKVGKPGVDHLSALIHGDDAA